MKSGILHIGIDPGSSSGGVCFIKEDQINAYRFKDYTESELLDIFYSHILRAKKSYCVIEKVWAFPGQGISSACKFCSNSGFFRGVILAMGVSLTEHTPRSWMKTFGMKKEKEEAKIAYKKRLKALAQKTYPGIKIVTETADAVLIAHYTKKLWT